MNQHYDFKNLPVILVFLLAGFIVSAQNSNEKQPPAALLIESIPEGGFYEHDLTIQLLAPGAAIYFTTDGSKPSESPSLRYKTPIQIQKTTVIRAFAVRAGEKSPVFSSTYFVNEPSTTFPVVSISINAATLFDPESGLFMKGPNANDTLWQLPGANFWSRRESNANVEFFDENGKCAWRNQVGFRLFGGMSRIFPQKSMALVARKRYGENRIEYPVFGKKGLKKFKYLVLRNSGSDFGKTHFRDALMTHLVKDWDLDVQDYRPAHVYLNGTYWGIYNIREKINRYYVAAHHDVDKDSMDLIEHRLTRRFGSTSHYRRLISFLEKNSLSAAKNFAWVNSQMEVGNFLDYQIAQIYFDNQDAGGNIKFWRPQTPNGRWRWILYDTDWGFGLNDPSAWKNNSLAFHTEPNGPSWPNPAWSTLILRKLLENKDFERRFINRFADYLNSDLKCENVLATIEKFYNRLLPEMPRHLKRWRLSESAWNREVNVLRRFAKERPAYIRKFLAQKFNTGEQRTIHLIAAKGGQIVVNENVESRDTFTGIYFEKIPISLKAIPDLGYRFVRWEGKQVNSASPELLIELTTNNWHIKAVFEKYEHPLANKIVINEISCNNKQSGDWIEIYNNSKNRVNLRDWILTDSKNEFRFPEYNLPPKGYVVVCEDSAKFLKIHPTSQSVIGGLNFGWNKRREIIQLFSPEAAAVDSTGYELEPSDSIFTLNLLLPTLDNGNPENWEITAGVGSPGAANAYFVASRIQGQRLLWMQIGGALGIIGICIILLRLRSKGKL